ncbi:protein NRT1/ PTR FAMILY 1.2-like [Quercus robur]|uniref:protein NRT1/ PTR FAMILY 1.2-like n=1 Tax=Quercus robur TaxID=38942 RepID=UPI002163739C|nr:protein NRT1/ PTR FAMILY 1.2-like [Quercus robur]
MIYHNFINVVRAANETFEKVASFGLQANMKLYLILEYNMDSATGAIELFQWSAISNLITIIGAFLSDSYLGRFRVIAYGTISSLLGMSVLWLTAILPQARPPPCKHNKGGEKCVSPSSAQLALFFSAFVLMSVGAGGIRPCSLAVGADKFNQLILQTFFNWYYDSVGISVMLAATVMVCIQNAKGWVVGFGIPVVLMLFSSTMFFLGSPLYIKMKAKSSLLTGFAQVIVATWRNRHLSLPEPPLESDGWYHHKASKLTAPTDNMRFLNKACIIGNPLKDLDSDGLAMDPWSLCTITQVEELKALIKVLPIWSTGIPVAVTLNEHSFGVLQAKIMDRRFFLSKFKIPPASFSVFGILSMTATVVFYVQVLVPFLSKFTKRKRGLSLRERMGIGIAISCLATAVSAIVKRNSGNSKNFSQSIPWVVELLKVIWGFEERD